MGLHRFGLLVECGSAFPAAPGRQPLRLHPALVELAEKHLACTFHDDIGAIV